MIPAYFQSLATTVRDLVASGKAVHVTNETAAELDLLAGLPWGSFSFMTARAVSKDIDWGDGHVEAVRVQVCYVTPADIALGWLLASRAQPQEDYIEGPNDVVRIERILDDGAKRAAECAELAALAPIASPAENLIKDFVASLGTGEPPRMLRRVYAHDGTREGARAAWGFVVQCIETQQRNSMVAHAFEGNPQTWQAWQGMRDRYRRELRELEAM